jgi:ribosomal protein L32
VYGLIILETICGFVKIGMKYIVRAYPNCPKKAWRKRKEKTEREKEEAKCPSCGVLWTFSSHICGSCGYERSYDPM